MESYANAQFRMTLWPGAPLLLPPLLGRHATYELHSSGLALVGKGSAAVGPAARLGEVYLDLYAVDLDDPDAILAFANTYGTPSGALVYMALAGHSLFETPFSSTEDARLRETIIS